MNARKLFFEIERYLSDGGDWCSAEKANQLVALIVGLRPKLVVEIGVWRGGSLVPMLLALKAIDDGKAIAIDPWSNAASIAEEPHPANVKWWGEVDHQAAHDAFVARLAKHELDKFCEIWRRPSDACEPPGGIGLLHIDGNHNEQAVRDVERFASRVSVGGILVLDDIEWSSGSVQRAQQLAEQLGFVELYQIAGGSGCAIMQRVTS